MRRVKTFLKKYYFPILTEAIILCIIFVLSYQMIATEKSNVNNYNIYEYLTSFNEYEGDNPVNDFFFKILIGFGYPGDKMVDKRNSCYGIAVRLYDSSGNIITETPPRFLAVEYWPYPDEQQISEKGEVIFLEEYFSDKELDKLLKFVNKHVAHIETMTGYYENEKFVPVEILFTEFGSIGPARTYTLTNQNADTQGKPLEGMFRLHFFNTRPDIQEKVQKLLDIPYTYDITYHSWYDGKYSFNRYCGTTTKQNNLSYDIITCVDTTALAWYASLCDTFMVPMWILCQGLGIVLIIVYIRLQRKQDKLDEMRDTFLNAMAHEMKTPAAVIKNSSECIQAGIQPEKHKHYLEMIEKEADHMNQLLNTMLIYTRTREAAYVLELEEHDILQHARQTLKHYETLIQQKDIDAQWDVKSSQPFRYDKKLMEMVLDNFFSNAIKFCPEHKTIRITIKENEFSIYNDGAIISEENKKRIWEPLFQINTARSSEDNSSSGMGLAISAGILNLHHAVYGVINKLDGVEFYFRL